MRYYTSFLPGSKYFFQFFPKGFAQGAPFTQKRASRFGNGLISISALFELPFYATMGLEIGIFMQRRQAWTFGAAGAAQGKTLKAQLSGQSIMKTWGNTK